jgi:hypothetical protein
MISHKRLLQLLSYDPETGHFTRLTGRGGFKPGTRSGFPDSYGYTIVRVDGRPYLASRLAFFYMNKRWPAQLMDHINRCRSDDRFSNLREATFMQNSANKSRSKGYSIHGDKWRARIRHKGKYHHLGIFESKEEATAAYKQAAVKLHGEYAP